MKNRAALVVLVLLAACSDDDSSTQVTETGRQTGGSSGTGFVGIEGDGVLVTEARTVTGFQGVVNDSPLPVDITQGAEFKVEIAFDSNLLPLITSEVMGDTLHIGVRAKDGFTAHTRGQVTIRMPHLTSALSSASGDLIVATVEEAPIRLATSGSGDMAFQGSASSLDVATHGSGAIELSGSAQRAELTTAGSGDIDARQLIVVEGEVSTSGSGDISATFTGTVDASTSGSGDIDLYGGATVTQDRSGSGRVTIH
jgi:hypothetical protein